MNTQSRYQSHFRIFQATGWLFMVLLLAGCTTSTPPSPSTAHTLHDVPGLPTGPLSQLFKPAEWQRLANLRYTGYVVLRGHVEANRSISDHRVIKSYPDHLRDQQAIEFCDDIRITATTIGSRVKPTARVYVIFYETPPIRTALIFGQADDSIAPTGTDEQARRVLIKSY